MRLFHSTRKEWSCSAPSSLGHSTRYHCCFLLKRTRLSSLPSSRHYRRRSYSATTRSFDSEWRCQGSPSSLQWPSRRSSSRPLKHLKMFNDGLSVSIDRY
ncbi:hypothetical protein PFISCL1PPCAC_14209 [Pristionchus fissidentatus]|uniref:Uncharacterized protein n=1 Tax=Pristionchus fissidentatus TaxID=1538716 RepID=A0AAV5VT99_9BILA|nr:hypothetical protein PFISCL1PPCAC_14209 [Pristionchus fissidentatus]